MQSEARRWPLWYVPIGLAVVWSLRGALHAVPGLPRAGRTGGFDAVMLIVPVALAATLHAASPRTFCARRMRITPGRAALWIFLGSLLTSIAGGLYVVLFDIDGRTWLTGYYPHGTEAVVLGVSAVTLVPVAEEVFWRGFVHRALRTRIGLWPAVALSSSLFGLAHWAAGDDFSTVTPRVFYGVLLALLLERTGSLYPGIVAHAYLNVPVLELFVPSLTWPAIAIVLVALVVAVAVSVNDDRRKTLRSRGSRPHDPAAAEAALRAQLARRHAEASGHPRPW